jgi:hypothetical protein
MYSDPANIRSIVIPVRLNENEAALLAAVTQFTGQQKSTLLREMFIEQARLVLSGQADLGRSSSYEEAAFSNAVAAR